MSIRRGGKSNKKSANIPDKKRGRIFPGGGKKKVILSVGGENT